MALAIAVKRPHGKRFGVARGLPHQTRRIVAVPDQAFLGVIFSCPDRFEF